MSFPVPVFRNRFFTPLCVFSFCPAMSVFLPAFAAHPAIFSGVQVPLRETALPAAGAAKDRKSTRLNSSHTVISYAVFCLKKKTYENTNRHLCMHDDARGLLGTRFAKPSFALHLRGCCAADHVDRLLVEMRGHFLKKTH